MCTSAARPCLNDVPNNAISCHTPHKRCIRHMLKLTGMETSRGRCCRHVPGRNCHSSTVNKSMDVLVRTTGAVSSLARAEGRLVASTVSHSAHALRSPSLNWGSESHHKQAQAAMEKYRSQVERTACRTDLPALSQLWLPSLGRRRSGFERHHRSFQPFAYAGEPTKSSCRAATAFVQPSASAIHAISLAGKPQYTLRVSRLSPYYSTIVSEACE